MQLSLSASIGTGLLKRIILRPLTNVMCKCARSTEFSHPRILCISIYLSLFLGGALQTFSQEKIFSGPQPDEKLAPFEVRGVFGSSAGKSLDFVKSAGNNPIVLIFVHDVTRPSVSMTRVLSSYTVSRVKEGLHTGIVWLKEDATEAENELKRIAHALTADAPIGISIDGREGPGSYGLNRSVMLTILVGKEGKVTANFPLVQPSLQADLPKILHEIVKVAGGVVPKLEDLPGMSEMMRRATIDQEPDAELRNLLRPLIQKNASPADVDKAAQSIERHIARNPRARTELGRIANTIAESGKLGQYGTPPTQAYLKKWAKEIGKPAANADNVPKQDDRNLRNKETKNERSEG